MTEETMLTTPEITTERRLEILESLRSTACGPCGGTKRSMMSHCRRCYYALPPQKRQALYKRFGRGYEEAYEDSLRYLESAREQTTNGGGTENHD